MIVDSVLVKTPTRQSSTIFIRFSARRTCFCESQRMFPPILEITKLCRDSLSGCFLLLAIFDCGRDSPVMGKSQKRLFSTETRKKPGIRTMRTLNQLLCVAVISSVAFATQTMAAEGSTSRVSAHSPAIRNAAKAKDILIGFSQTTDVDIWITYGDSPRTAKPHIRVNFANLGANYSYSRDYVLVFTSANHTLLIFDQETGILAPNASGSKVFVIPKDFIDNGSVVEVALLGSDDNPNNDYDAMLLPSTPGI